MLAGDTGLVSQDIVVALSGRESGSMVTHDHLVAAKELRGYLEQRDIAHQAIMRLRTTVLVPMLLL